MRDGHALWGAVVVTLAAAAFILPARAATGVWPIPLDDVYIYFAHARAIGEGAPGAWIAGQGYSSGATALGYPFLLAPFWLLGLRDSALGGAAFGIALVAVVDFSRSLARLHRESGTDGLYVAPLVVSVPLLDWSLWSGMEAALFAALLGRALVAARAAKSSAVRARRRHQGAAGLWLAALVLTRPEAIPFAMALATAVVWSARSLSTASTLMRVAAPSSLALLGQAALQRFFTGEWLAAGAIRKALWSPPHAEALDVARAWLANLVVLLSQAFVRPLGGAAAIVFALLAAMALAHRRSRRLALPLAFGIVGGLVLVCANATARFQNYRYVAPLLLMVIALAVLGLGVVARRQRRLAALFALGAMAAPAGQWAREIDHFARASSNIAEQHLEVARRLAALPRGRVFVNDAGAIAYLGDRSAIDGFGLGGFRQLPFARASTAGVPAVIELVERLPEGERPALLAVYPGWWPGLVEVFARRLDAVAIDDNVICGAAEKVIYAADWSLLEERSEGLDVGDLVDEAEHDHDGQGALVTRIEGGLWDAGRSYPPGIAETFRLPAGICGVETRTDATVTLEVRLSEGREIAPPRRIEVAADAWSWLFIDLGGVAEPGEERVERRIELRAIDGTWRAFHHRFVACGDARLPELSGAL